VGSLQTQSLEGTERVLFEKKRRIRAAIEAKLFAPS
jgi:hypothetical protein